MGHWQGWIEFLPQTGGSPLQTGRETTQSHYEHLVYWATGLSPTYMEMALERAAPTTSGEPPPPPPLMVPVYDPARIRDEHTDSSVVHLVIETLDPTLPRRLMGTAQLAPGRVRHVPGGGILVYDGVSGAEGEPSRHAFLLQYGSENAAAVVANHLWSDLHGEGATLRIEGEKVELENHAIHLPLRRRLPAYG